MTSGISSTLNYSDSLIHTSLPSYGFLKHTQATVSIASKPLNHICVTYSNLTYHLILKVPHSKENRVDFQFLLNIYSTEYLIC